MAKVIFDLDGVLIRSREKDGQFLWSKNLSRDLFLPDHVRTRLFEQPDWTNIITGQMKFDDKLQKMYEAEDYRGNPKEFVDYWLKNDLHWNSKVIRLAEKLRKKGLKIYIASNQDALRTAYLRKQFEVKELFDGFTTSAELGFAKPDPMFFIEVRKKFSFTVDDQMLLIDDSSNNVLSAESVGWKGITFDPDMDSNASVENLEQTIQAKIGKL